MKRERKTDKKILEKPHSIKWSLVLQFLLGLGISWIGVRKLTFYPQNWWYGYIAQAIAGCLILFSFPKKSPVLDWEGNTQRKTEGGVVSRKINSWLLVVVLVLLGLSVYFFYCDYFIAGSGFGLLDFGFLIFINKRNNFNGYEKAEFDFSEEKWFWVLMIFTLALRFAFVGTNLTGLQGDEGNNLTDAIAIGKNHPSPFETAWGGTPIFPYYYYVLIFKILGPKLWAARFGSSVASIVAVYFFYKWIRLWFSPLTALIGTFWLAVSWWFFYFSLSPFHNSILAMEEIGSFYFFEKGFRSGRRSCFCWAGLMTAACVMNYVSGRSVPIMLTLVVIAYIVFRGWSFVKNYWKQLILCLASFWWLAGPFLVYACIHPGEVWGRVQPGWIAQEAQHSGSYFFLLKAYGWTLVTLWAVNPSVDFRFVVPGMTFMDPITGIFALLGVGVCLSNLKKPLAWVLIPGLFFGLSANALARLGWPADLAYIQLVRLSIVIPFVFLMAAWGLDWFLKSYRKFFPKGWGWCGLLVTAAVAGPLLLNEPVFLSRFAFQPGTWGDHGLSFIKLSEVVVKEAPTHQFLIDSDATSNAVNFLTFGGDPNLAILDLQKDIPVLYQAQKNVMLIFSPWRINDSQRKALNRFYPKAIWTTYSSPWGDRFLFTVDIPLDEFLAAQKGRKLLTPLPLN